MNDGAYEKRMMVREAFIRYFAVLIAVMAFAVLWKVIPADIDFDSPSQTLYLGNLTGAVLTCLNLACLFYFHIVSNGKPFTDKDGDGKPDDAP